MSTRQQRINIFNDTMEWIQNDPDLSRSVQDALKKESVYYEDDYPHYDTSAIQDGVIHTGNERSFAAAMRLHKLYPQSKIAVLNFANSVHAGGGVTSGSSAQEESLCRTSTLYPLLHNNVMHDTFYEHHRLLETPKASDTLIYTRDVIVCKSDEDLPKRLDKGQWLTLDVVTMAAPDLRNISMQDAVLYAYHVKRAMHMLTVCAHEHVDILVLGAFGCGAFRNNPAIVAMAYQNVLSVFPKLFKHVEFAVYCKETDLENYNIFKSTLG